MFDFTYEQEQLDSGSREVSIVKSIINKHKIRSFEMKQMHNVYKGEESAIEIYNRMVKDPLEVNNMVNHDFAAYIVDTKIGYFAGTPAAYSPSEPRANEQFNDDFAVRNRLSDVDAETAKMAAICGYAPELLYVDRKGDIRMKNVMPFQAISFGENGMDEPDYGLRYYYVQVADNEKQLRAELYDDYKVYEFRGRSEGDLEFFAEQEHPFGFCPLICTINNEELLSDVEKVMQAINSYDRAVSDRDSEFEAHRAAILAFYGVEPPVNDDKEEPEADLTKAGVLYFREGQKGEYIVKNVPSEAIESHLSRLKTDIYQLSKTPDFTDEAFSGVQSGVAMRFKLISLENKVATFERKFKSARIRLFEILSAAWSKKGLSMDPLKVDMKFKRNIPLDLLFEANASAALKGQVSEKTRLSLFSFIEDPEEELRALEEERAAYAIEFEKTDPVDDADDDEGGAINDDMGTVSATTS